jgi:hypothetical protein
MAMLELVFDGKAFPVPKRSLFELFEYHRDLFDATSYAVQSAVPLNIFEMFVTSLKTQSKISVTKGNAASLSLLASEFFLPELAAECAPFSVQVDPIASLSDRVCKLELRVSSTSNPPRKIEEKIESQEEALENLHQEVDRQRVSIDRQVAVVASRVDELLREFGKLRGDLKAVNDSAGGEIGKLKSATAKVAKSVSGLDTLRREFDDLKVSVDRLQQAFTRVGSPKAGDTSSDGDKAASPKPVPPVQQQPTPRPSPPTPTQLPPSDRHMPSPSPKPPAKPQPTSEPPPSVCCSQKSPSKVEIPMKGSRSKDGIISYLTTKHRGNLQEKGLVTISSKSVSDTAKHVLSVNTLHSGVVYFYSKNEPGQWVCWDFREMRIRLTHYTIGSHALKSWVVEGSLDGRSWTEIDRQTDNQDFNHTHTGSFAVSNPVEFRFIRLTQTDTDHNGRDTLTLCVAEFFGTLSE